MQNDEHDERKTYELVAEGTGVSECSDEGRETSLDSEDKQAGMPSLLGHVWHL